MAGWRQVVELAMTRGGSCEAGGGSRVRARNLRAGWSGRKMLLAYRENPSFLRPHEEVGGHHQTVQPLRSNEALAYGPPGGARRPTATWQRAANHHAGGQEAWIWLPWPCDKAKEHGYPRTSCGPRAFWHAMRASMGRRRERCTGAWPGWFRAPSCKILPTGKKSRPHKVRYYLECRDAEFEQKMAEVLCTSIARSKSSRRAAAKPKKNRQAGGDRLLRRKAGNPGHRHDVAGVCRLVPGVHPNLRA